MRTIATPKAKQLHDNKPAATPAHQIALVSTYGDEHPAAVCGYDSEATTDSDPWSRSPICSPYYEPQAELPDAKPAALTALQVAYIEAATVRSQGRRRRYSALLRKWLRQI